MITDEQLKQYREEGYIIFEDLFSESEIDRLRERIDKYDEKSEQELKKIGQRFNSIAGQINFTAKLNLIDPEIQKFACQKRFADITMPLIGPDVQLYWDQSVYKRPEASRDFPWHQDNGYIPIEPEHYVTCWIALEDSTIENGCIWIQKGTHLKGLVEHTKTDIGWQCYFGDDPGTPVPLNKGSMVVFHSLLFHRSSPNRSQTTRKAYITQYSQAGAYNPQTNVVFNNGPVIAREGKHVYI